MVSARSSRDCNNGNERSNCTINSTAAKITLLLKGEVSQHPANLAINCHLLPSDDAIASAETGRTAVSMLMVFSQLQALIFSLITDLNQLSRASISSVRGWCNHEQREQIPHLLMQ